MLARIFQRGPRSPFVTACLIWTALQILAPAGSLAATKDSVTELPNVYDGQHWSFLPIKRPSPPDVNHSDWPRGAIDRLVLARLEREGVTPSPEADRPTLIRRISLDLTGLPPTPDEVEEFAADERPDAYELLVDRLLASPHFGERMALDWLDGARYADTFGFHEDWPREIWAWRDWVITAFNNNLPFDQFTIDQLAADLLPGATQDQLVATGFNRLHCVTADGDPDEFRARAVIDRVTTTSTVWMGLTTGCAQCHDHMYDPISQVEFYRLYAFFNRMDDPPIMGNDQGNLEPLIALPSPEQSTQLASMATEARSAEQELEKRTAEAGSPSGEWQQEMIAKFAKSAAQQGMIVYGEFESPSNLSGRNAAQNQDQSSQGQTAPGDVGLSNASQINAQGHVDLANAATFDRSDKFSFSAWIRPVSARGPLVARIDEQQGGRGYDIILEGGKVAVHLIHQWPGSAIQVLDREPIGLNQWVHVCVTYDGSSTAEGVKIFVDGKLRNMEVTHSNLDGTIKTEKPLTIGRRKDGELFDGSISDLRSYDRQLMEEEVSTLSDRGARVLAIPAEKRTEDEEATLKKYYLEHDDSEYMKLAEHLKELRKKEAELKKAVPTTMVMRESEHPRQSFVLKRGLWNQPGDAVTPGTPASLPPLPDGAPANRLGLARWLVDPSHPLTSRVIVNRYWQLLFGTGFVATPEDFGAKGDPPSHPELLDFLAAEFMDSGWDVKALLRMIVTSATYRQDSRVRSSKLEDPDNRLLARGPRFRLPAEILRDNALAASGLLVQTIGGPSVRPYQPAGLWMEAGNREYVQDHGEKLYRRSLYTYWRRIVPPPSMIAFDATNRDVCVARRQRSNTPLAALAMMNDPTFVEAARALAERAMTKGGLDPEKCANVAFQLVTARQPQPAERLVLVELYHQQLAAFRSNEQAARELLAVGESARNDKLDVAQHAAWTSVATMILNFDEAITKE